MLGLVLLLSRREDNDGLMSPGHHLRMPPTAHSASCPRGGPRGSRSVCQLQLQGNADRTPASAPHSSQRPQEESQNRKP